MLSKKKKKRKEGICEAVSPRGIFHVPSLSIYSWHFPECESAGKKKGNIKTLFFGKEIARGMS